ncbi:MAG: VOC family protein [Phycisphaerae bacterium]|nr:VOC family protein [Phycisphaerae bacterium]
MTIDFRFSPNVAVQVRERSRAVAFYREVLGFEVLKEGATETKLRKGPMTFFVEGIDGASASSAASTAGAGPAPNGAKTPGTTFWEFEVADFASAETALRGAGCRETSRYAPTSAMFADPYGLRFHVFQTGTDLPDCP